MLNTDWAGWLIGWLAPLTTLNYWESQGQAEAERLSYEIQRLQLRLMQAVDANPLIDPSGYLTDNNFNELVEN